jgi:hypothetical protein
MGLQGRWGTAALLAAGVAAYAALAVSASRTKSSTFDEPIHLPPGYVSLTLGDHRMNPDHPPLVRRLAALPLLFMDVRFDPEDFAWRVGRPWEFGKRFLYRWNDAETLLFWGRLPIVALGAALLAAVFLWTRRHWGKAAGALALLLAAFNPELLAHGAIVSTDVGIALFSFLTVVAFGAVVETVTAARVLRAGLALGAACATKFSGVGLLLMLAVPALAIAADARPIRLRLLPSAAPREVGGRGRKLALLSGVLAAMGLVAILTIWTAYGFHSPLAVDPEANARIFDWREVALESPALQAFFSGLRALSILPEAWIWGFLHFLVHAEGRPAFLLGQYSEGGFWYYFPAAFALKAPIALLLLLALALPLARRTAKDPRAEWLLWAPMVLFWLLSMSRSINIGLRHLLPALPFMIVAASRVAAAAFPSGGGRRVLPAVVLVLGAAQVVSTLRAWPSYLAYFNELAGGARAASRYLVDSNLDWGQDLPGLRRWMEATGVPRVKLAYFGTADVKYYGVAADRLPGYQPPPPSATVHEVVPGDLVAVSATLLRGVYVDPPVLPLMERLRARPPVAVIGGSIFLYKADFTWQGAEAAVAAPGAEP